MIGWAEDIPAGSLWVLRGVVWTFTQIGSSSFSRWYLTNAELHLGPMHAVG